MQSLGCCRKDHYRAPTAVATPTVSGRAVPLRRADCRTSFDPYLDSETELAALLCQVSLKELGRVIEVSQRAHNTVCHLASVLVALPLCLFILTCIMYSHGLTFIETYLRLKFIVTRIWLLECRK